jgi:hypothetical protein
LVWNQQTYWNLAFTNCATGLPLSLVGATIDAQIVRRQVSNIVDTRNGLTFDIADYTPTPTPVSLTITNRVDAADATWSLINSDPQLEINAQDCVGFSGRVKVSFPASGSTPPDDAIIFLLFLVRSDGVVVV